MKSPRLVFVSRLFWPIAGLTELALSELACAMQNAGAHVEIISARWDKNWPAEFFYRSIPVIRIAKPVQGPWGAYRYLRNLVRQLTVRMPLDGVLVTGLSEEAATVIQAFGHETPIVIRVDRRQLPPGMLRGPISRRQLAALHQARAIVTNCENLSRQLQRLGIRPDLIRVIRPGIAIYPKYERTVAAQVASRLSLAEAHPILSVEPGQPLVCSGMAMDDEGGLLDLLAAWPTILQAFPKAKLWLLGDGPQAQPIWEAIVSRNLVHSAIMPGNFDDLGTVFRAADLYVHPARSEDACDYLVQALGAALPAVATSSNFVRSLIEQNVSGLLTAPRNPPAMAEAIIHALDRPHLRSRIGSAAQQTIADQHSFARELHQYLELFSPPVDMRCESVT